MRLKTNDGIDYIGKVKISYTKRNSNVIFVNHNNGKALLFKTIAQAMVGYNVSGKLPDKMNLQIWDNDKNVWLDCLESMLPISRRVVLENKIDANDADNNTFSVIYTALLSRGQLKTFNEGIYRLQLCDRNDKVLADTEVDYVIISDIEKGGGIEALIEWSLTFQNKIVNADEGDESNE